MWVTLIFLEPVMEEASSIVFIGETIQRDILLFIVKRRSFR